MTGTILRLIRHENTKYTSSIKDFELFLLADGTFLEQKDHTESKRKLTDVISYHFQKSRIENAQNPLASFRSNNEFTEKAMGYGTQSQYPCFLITDKKFHQ